jgi:hypothetical protein
MKKRLFQGIAFSGVAMLCTATAVPTIAAAQNMQMYQANLSALNNSGTTGTATVSVEGDQATVTLNTTGASANLPHAQHIHIGGNNVCATMDDDENGDGVLTTAEGQPSYGTIKVSLTESGDVSADSGLAVKRFPSANGEGKVSYSRTFTLPEGVNADDIAKGVVVQHGVASLTGDKTKYDGEQKSALNKDLPREATVPAACGKLTSMPNGGVGTGLGSTDGVEHGAFLAIGGAAILAAGVLIGYGRYGLGNTQEQ